MNSAWKTNSPTENPATYSTIRSIHIGRPSVAVMTAAAMIPVASPATQWIVEPMPCFDSGLMKSSCVPGCGSLSASTYSRSPSGPVYSVTRMKPHFITIGSGLLRYWSTATYSVDAAASANQTSRK